MNLTNFNKNFSSNSFMNRVFSKKTFLNVKKNVFSDLVPSYGFKLICL